VNGGATGASVGTLARGLDVLELFASHAPAMTQKEIASRLGLPGPTVHRLTRLLLERGYLVRDSDGRRLRLGLGLVRLLPAVLSGLRLPDVARERLRALAEETGETASLAVLHGGDVVYLVSESGGNLLTLRAGVGLHLPSHSTALGKCLLAQLPDAEARRAAGREPYPALTARTLTSWEELRKSLEEVRRTGVALSHGEYELGLDALAVPVAWSDGAGPVAINVSLPSTRATADVRDAVIERLRETGRAIGALAAAA
jgi:IclR family acetate operon transcriptional repressor